MRTQKCWLVPTVGGRGARYASGRADGGRSCIHKVDRLYSIDMMWEGIRYVPLLAERGAPRSGRKRALQLRLRALIIAEAIAEADK